MSERYFITGVQLGMLMSLQNEKDKMEILQEIMDNQYIGDKEEFDILRLRQIIQKDDTKPTSKIRMAK